MKPILRAGGSSRRCVLKMAAGVAAAFLTGKDSRGAAFGDTSTAGNRKRALRIAHLTDIHVKPELQADKGLATCLRHVQEHHKPDLILDTGDTIFDSMAAEESRVRSLWELSQKIWKAECGVPVERAIGNHDVWGIRKKGSKTTGNEPLYGKKWIMSLHGWERPYRSFDRGGWHFVALDSVSPKEDGYIGHIDDEQFEWLGQDLARVAPRTPVLLFCHIPILSAAAFLKREPDESGDWRVPASRMLIDARRLKDLFYKHRNVKVCLSGHLHVVDRVDYLGVSYLCGGAVSGGWWKGNCQECEPGYAVIDLYTDGTFDNKYVTYGWKPQA